MGSDPHVSLDATKLKDWLPLLEMFSDGHVVLHGAAGEDAMNVGDILGIVRYAIALADALEDVTCGWHDIDERIRYVETQIDKSHLKEIFKLLGKEAPSLKELSRPW